MSLSFELISFFKYVVAVQLCLESEREGRQTGRGVLPAHRKGRRGEPGQGRGRVQDLASGRKTEDRHLLR